MAVKIAFAGIILTVFALPVFAQGEVKKHSPAELLKDYALTTCIADGLSMNAESKGDKAIDYAAAAAREYLEHGQFPIEAYTEAASLGRSFLSKQEYKNIYSENLLFIKCVDFYNSAELSKLAKKYSPR